MTDGQPPLDRVPVPYNTLEHWEYGDKNACGPRFRARRRIAKAMGATLKVVTRRASQALLGGAATFLPEPRRLPAAEDVRQIVMFGDMGIGNFIMATPLLRALRRHFTAAEIVVVFIKGRGAEEVAARLDSVDRLVRIPEVKAGRASDARPFLRAVRTHGLAPQVLVGRFNRSPFIPLFAVATRPAWRVGHTSSAGFIGFCDGIYNYPVPMRAEEHEVERNLNLARALGVPVERCVLEFALTGSDIAQADEVCAASGALYARLVCLQMGSSEIQKWKRWPEQSWAALMRALAAEGWTLALLGSREESGLSQKIADASGVRAANLCGKLSLGGVGALLKSARLLVCNDSGLMHVGAAVGTPIIGLFGPTEYERTRPWTERFVGLRGPCACNAGTLFDRATLKKIEACARPCLTRTHPEHVMTEMRALLGSPGSIS
jgi:lipopolysaccharide heptosyltransferase II